MVLRICNKRRAPEDLRRWRITDQGIIGTLRPPNNSVLSLSTQFVRKMISASLRALAVVLVLCLVRPVAAQDVSGEDVFVRLSDLDTTATFDVATPGNRSSVFANTLPVLTANAQLPVVGWDTREVNFALNSYFFRAGDVTGNGTVEVFQRYQSRDERSSDPLAVTPKTLLFFVDDISGEVDQIIYDHLFPVGDMDGDGHADALSVGADGSLRLYRGGPSGYVTPAAVLGAAPSGPTNLIHGSFDLDGDGHRDALLYHRGTGSARPYVLFGAADPASMTSREVPVPSSTAHVVTPVVTEDGETYLVGVTGGSSPVVFVVSIDEAMNLSITHTTPLASSVAQFGVAGVNLFPSDIDGDGDVELLILGPEQPVIYRQNPDADGLEFLPNAMPFGQGVMVPIGDLDGDGRTDFLIQTNGNAFALAYGPSDLNDGLSADFPLPIRSDEALNIPLPGYPNRWGDITGNGLDDIIVRGQSFAGYRHYVLEGSATRDHEVHELFFDAREIERDLAVQTVSLGQLAGDGVEYLGVLYQQSDPRVEIWQGGSSLDAPVATIRSDRRGVPMDVVAGRFVEGDGEFAVSWRITTANRRDSYMEIRSGVAADVLSTVELSTLVPNRNPADEQTQGIANLANVGDVDGDGFDNLLVGIPYILTGPNNTRSIVALLSSGTSISSPVLHRFDSPSSHLIGSTIAGIGDFTGNGHPDFAIIRSRTSIEIYEGWGADGSPSLGAPARTLLPAADEPSGSLGIGLTGLAAGDFNGDGRVDIAVSNYATPILRSEPVPSIYVYYGASSSDRPSHTVTLSTHAFGGASPDYIAGPLSEITTIPDVNGNGIDELLIGSMASSDAPLTNALLLIGLQSGFSEEHGVVLEAVHGYTGLGANNNDAHIRRSSAVMDFTGDGVLDVFLPQQGATGDRGTPIVHYVLDPEAFGTSSERPDIASEFGLRSVYPNPSSAALTFSFDAPSAGQVHISVYDILGREVHRSVSENVAPGHRSITIDPATPSGTYMYRLVFEGAGERQEAKGSFVRVR